MEASGHKMAKTAASTTACPPRRQGWHSVPTSGAHHRASPPNPRSPRKRLRVRPRAGQQRWRSYALSWPPLASVRAPLAPRPRCWSIPGCPGRPRRLPLASLRAPLFHPVPWHPLAHSWLPWALPWPTAGFPACSPGPPCPLAVAGPSLAALGLTAGLYACSPDPPCTLAVAGPFLAALGALLAQRWPLCVLSWPNVSPGNRWLPWAPSWATPWPP